MGLDDRDYTRERYRKRQGLGPEKTQWNDRAGRVEMASGAWFASKDQGFDYQKGRHRLAPVFPAHPTQKWIFALSALLALIPAYREVKRNGWLPDLEAAHSFPGSGSVTVSRSVNPRKATAHLRVVTAKANAVVQLYDDETDRHVISVYVARDDDVTVPIPPGTFRMRLVEGDKWHSRTRYFGSSTTSDTVVGLMTFDRHTTRWIDLHRRPDGNLPTRADLTNPEPLN